MKNIVRLCALIVLAGVSVEAQNPDTPKEAVKYYKLDFVVKDMDGGKVLTARNYSMVVSTQGNESQIRAGSKVPLGTHYADVGTNIDCKNVIEKQNDIALSLKVEISSLLQDNDPNPVIRQNTWGSDVIVPLKKPTTVFASDDSTTKRTIQFEVTVTPRQETK